MAEIIELKEFVKLQTEFHSNRYNRYLSITDLAAFIRLLSEYDQVVLGEHFTIVPFFKHLNAGIHEFDGYDFSVLFKENPTKKEAICHNKKERELDYHADLFYCILNDSLKDKMWLLMDKSNHKAFIKALKNYFEALINEILPQIYEKAILTNEVFVPTYLGYFSFEICAE